MRGKHGAAAANRREREELEQRAVKAEAKAARLETELNTAREASESSTMSLRTELAQARKDRDTAAAPVLAQAEERIRSLLTQRDTAIRDAKKTKRTWETCAKNLHHVLTSAGFSSEEAMEIFLATVVPDSETVPVVHGGARNTGNVDMVLAVQKARGRRHPKDPLSVLRATD